VIKLLAHTFCGKSFSSAPHKTLKSYRELEVWKLAITFTVDIYEETKGFPNEERFGLVSQMRRAAVSIPANIAEGHGRRTSADKTRFLYMARGSVNECETLAILSEGLGYMTAERAGKLTDTLASLGRLLSGLIQYLEKQ
jgi:four helix bundle protein